MLSAYLAAKDAERRRAQRNAEFARQLPLYAEENAHPPLEYLRHEEEAGRTLQAPDWTSNY